MASAPRSERPVAPLRHLWPLPILALALVAGIAIAGYLTVYHENTAYGDASITLSNCPETETTNCGVVIGSEYSELLGVPISAFAIPTYLLLLGLLAAARRRPIVIAYVFGIGLLAVVYSGYLYYVSTVRIGYLCLWCFRLYSINAAIPLLASLAAWRSPIALLREAGQDLLRFVPEVRASSAAFAVLLMLVLAGDHAYRARLRQPAGSEAVTAEGPAPALASPQAAVPLQRDAAGSAAAGKEEVAALAAAAKPAADRRGTPLARGTLPAPPPSSVSTPDATAEGSPAAAGLPSGTLARLSWAKGNLRMEPFDLRAALGHGRPAAVLLWFAGMPQADEMVAEFVPFLRQQAPQMDVYLLAGKREEMKPEKIWEAVSMLPVAAELPVLLDDGFAFARQLDALDLPNLALFDAEGTLVTAKIKARNQLVTLAPEKLTGEQVILRVAQNATTQAPGPVPPYYPSRTLVGHCAPSFTLSDLESGKDTRFSGLSQDGRPTLLVFWSSTCKHCQKEIPQLLENYRAHPGSYDVVTVTSIKPDRPDGFSHRRVTDAYIRTKEIPWPVLDDTAGAVQSMYKVISTPTTFLIAPNGSIADIWYYAHDGIDAPLAQAVARMESASGTCDPASVDPGRVLEFSVTGPDDRAVPVASLIDGPTLVHLWATWCVPCRIELPSLLRYRDLLEREGGKLLLVSVEGADAGSRIRSFAGSLGLPFASYRAPRGGLADRLNLGYEVPRTFAVANGGKVLETFYGEQQWGEASFQARVKAILQLPRRVAER